MKIYKSLILGIVIFMSPVAFASAKEVSGVLNGNVVDNIKVSVSSGSYESIQHVEVIGVGAKSIRYTANDEIPNCLNSEEYRNKITIDKTTVLKVIACYINGESSRIYEYKYEINLPKSSGGSTSGSYPNKPNGEVLGAYATGGMAIGSCGKYLNSDIVYGLKNNKDEVIKLQKFLNKEFTASLPLTGYFGPLTRSYVFKFQDKYRDSIFAKDYAGKATGNVYKMTKNKIDLIACLQKQSEAK